MPWSAVRSLPTKKKPLQNFRRGFIKRKPDLLAYLQIHDSWRVRWLG